jgi:three-Cys-motif partner protein
MGKHEFGGGWTTDKLERVRKYLCAYTKIFKRNPGARYFRTTYVDAFAGTGHRADATRHSEEAALFDGEPDADAEAYKKGSARIALEVEPSFDHYLFIERSPDRVRDLDGLAARFPEKQRSVRIEQGDANQVLRRWCSETNWRKNRAVVFLDPYGMQVDWATMEALAGTRAVDLWTLFPLGVAVNRLLTREGPPPTAWADALSRMFGTTDWQSAFYSKHEEPTLFGLQSVQRKEVTVEQIGEFFVRRLGQAFSKVAPRPLPLLNSTNTPIYLLCFAAGNKKGAPTAIKIAQDILRP